MSCLVLTDHITYLTSKIFTPIKNYQEIQEIKNWFLNNYKIANAFPETFPIKFGEKDLQNLDAVKSAILPQYSTQYNTDIIHQAIDDIKEEYGDIAWEKKSLRVETKEGNIKHLDTDSYKEYAGPILNTKIYVPANGNVYEFEVNDMHYDITIHKISEQTIKESQVTKEMIDATGATHQGTIKFKDSQHGNIRELNKLIDMRFNKEYGLSFYSIINDEQEDYIDFTQAESDMEGWFSENYDDPANFLPYETHEGGYQYLYGGPYELDEILYEEFADKYPDEYIKRVIKGLEHQYRDVGLAKKPNESNYFEDGYVEKGYVEFDDPHDPLLREKEIKQMEADVLEKVIDDREKLAQIIIDLKKINQQDSNETIESQIDGEFNGWEGETIVKLMNGELWKQSEYHYENMYAYMPKVTIIHSSTEYKMKIDGTNKEVSVVKLNNDISLDGTTSDIVESKIDGDFNGWDGKTIFKLMNGQIWQQSKYAYHYKYKFMPKVIIYKTESGYEMKVDGDTKTVNVKRIQ